MKFFTLSKRDLILENLVWIGYLGLILFALVNQGGINILSHLLLGGFLLFLAVLGLLKKKAKEFKFGYESLFLLIFIVFFLISFLFSQTANVGLFEVILFVSGFIIYGFMSGTTWDEKKISKFFIGLSILTFLAMAWGYFQYIFEPFNRFAATFHNPIYAYANFPNAYANYLLAVVPFIVFLLEKYKSRLSQLILGGLLTLVLASFHLTFSRGGLIVLIIFGLIYFVYLLKQKKKREQKIYTIFRLFLIIGLSVLVMLLANFLRSTSQSDVNTLASKVTLTADEQSSSTSERIDFWLGSLALFKDNPIIGTGPGSFRYVYPKYQKEL